MKASKLLSTHAPLSVHSKNPRYFDDGTGKAILLSGSHTWSTIVDRGETYPPPRFDFDGFLDMLQERGHNFTRLWTQELAGKPAPGDKSSKASFNAPLPWLRTGPGKAADGLPKFNLNQLNPEYFERLGSRVRAMRDRGMYASVMLFEGWALEYAPKHACWAWHPFNIKNNINGIDGDPQNTGKGRATHSLDIPAITSIQEAYVRKVIETLNEYDNIFFEISNESRFYYSKAWQYHFIKYIKATEKELPKQHLVMMVGYGTACIPYLWNSPADIIGLNTLTNWLEHRDPFKIDPPIMPPDKISMLDTDHLWGTGGRRDWVWMSLTRGHHPIFMDFYPLENQDYGHPPTKLSVWKNTQINMGYALQYSRKMDLSKAQPRPDLALSHFCLANPGREYLVYLPKGGKTVVDITAVKGSVSVEWFNPANGKTAVSKKTITGGDIREFIAPFKGDAVLFLQRT
ncbi:MAG: hypothetical protein HC898_03385 [Phycisphaerales bacterium]|nr:hypothetical protein [Phycisphaerales bacterium]